MTAVGGEFHESSAEPVIRSLPLSHVSVELGHLYPEDVQQGEARFRAMFAEAAPWARTAIRDITTSGPRPRASTCFLVDDYFAPLPPPGEVIPQLVEAAAQAGLTIDYLAREAACAGVEDGPAGALSPAALLTAALVDEPAPGSIGTRPPAAESGWLCNGVRSATPGPASAMDITAPAWTPPRQNAAQRHSIFLDVQLWDGPADDRTWSCPMLAAVWQVLRLGLLRAQGRPLVDSARLVPGAWPDRWAELPPVVQLNPGADPFCAYSTVSVLSARFLPIEAAVRTILEQVRLDPAVLAQVEARAGQEGIVLPVEVPDRIGYAFAGRSDADPA